MNQQYINKRTMEKLKDLEDKLDAKLEEIQNLIFAVSMGKPVCAKTLKLIDGHVFHLPDGPYSLEGLIRIFMEDEDDERGDLSGQWATLAFIECLKLIASARFNVFSEESIDRLHEGYAPGIKTLHDKSKWKSEAAMTAWFLAELGWSFDFPDFWPERMKHDSRYRAALIYHRR
jgi:hypothetical protein